jgi:hypothetical protein
MPDKIHHSQDLDPPCPALRQWDVGVDQKGGEPIARIYNKTIIDTLTLWKWMRYSGKLKKVAQFLPSKALGKLDLFYLDL